MLELFLLQQGLQPAFYESGYNRYTEDVQFDSPELMNFKPDIVYFHTGWQNVSKFPEVMEAEEEIEVQVRTEVARFEALWKKVHSKLDALIIQNNFDLPRLRPMGNLEAFEPYGRIHFLMRLNAEFANYARRTRSKFLINDIHYLSAKIGLDKWHAYTYWYNFHMAVSPVATVALAQNLASIIGSAYGRSKKCLVLDLDNTLWGGVVGDDGVRNVILGRDHPLGEAFLDFQRYVKELRRRGVILAVCSKNDERNAKEGFSHPDSILTLNDFSLFKANWKLKTDNLREIASELNVGLDSLVFVDDNPAERLLVREQLPEVATPEVGSDVSRFAEILEAERYFEPHKVVQDDLNRAEYYKLNAEREALHTSCTDYGSFLASLEMIAEIAPLSPIYLDRVTQLINKTNQFNLTAKRYTAAQVEAIAQDEMYVALYGRLSDRFGDNGLVSVIIARIEEDTLEVELWIMSCRVFNREMELVMFDALVEQCQARGISKIKGIYISTKKNGMVAGHYGNLGFAAIEALMGSHQEWTFDVPREQSPKSRHIRRKEDVRGLPGDDVSRMNVKAMLTHL
jgi:FkbH-like protein